MMNIKGELQLNICIVNDNFDIGGVQRVAIELANTLEERGNQITLIDFSGKNNFYYKVNENINIPNAIQPRNLKRKIVGKILWTYSSISKKQIEVLKLYKEQIGDLLEYLKNNRHEILILCQGMLTALIPLVKEKISNIKVIAWQHNEYEIYVNQYYKRYIKNYLNGIKYADLVVSLTEDDQKRFGNINKNSTYIYNPLTLSNRENKISKLSNRKIIFVSRLEIEQKGLDYLIKIGKSLKDDWKIFIAGEGKDKKKLMKMIKMNNLQEKIILCGALKSEELEELYTSGSLFISTSRWEGFGLVITEAMLFGLPIISFNNRGPNEILKNGNYGILIEKNNINDFIKMVNNLIESPEKMQFYQKRSLERVMDFKKEIIIKKWEYNFKKLMDSD